MTRYTPSVFFALLCATALNTNMARAADPLLQDFIDPPQHARPHTWWHWLNGNVTREGIEKDLRWMKSVGLGGVQNFNASLGTPQIVEQPLGFMTAQWKDAFRFAVTLAEELDLDFAIAASPGWSETGGPWVKPEDGMKKLVWSETTVSGGESVAQPLPAPPRVTGAFQNVAFHDPLGDDDHDDLPQYYRDELVLAYPVRQPQLPRPVAQDQGGSTLDTAALLDKDFESVARLAKGNRDATPTLTYTFEQPVTVRSATLFIPRARPPFGESEFLPIVEVDDGRGWRKLSEVPLQEVPTTVSFAAVTAQRFRLVMAPNKPVTGLGGEAAPGAMTLDIFAREDKGYIEIGHWQLSGEDRVHQAEAKAGFAVVPDYFGLGISAQVANPVSPSEVIDLTDRLQTDGRLEWTAPAGNHWRILRLGYSLTGKTNHPAAADATGLEVDKYDAGAVRAYLQTYLAMYRNAVGEDRLGKNGVDAILTDSIEVGASNWTAGLVDKFKALRGYDPTPWLPSLTGAIIGTAEQSDAFLYDFRRTLADLLVDAHYRTLAEVAREHGLRVYGEALENGRPVLGDDLAMRSHAGVPMAALWTYKRDNKPQSTLLGDMKGAASVAHVYGQNLVAAESMTAAFSPWAFAPADLKRIIDLEFAYGVNRPVIHTSVHHPVDDKVPGLSLMVFGQYFNRHETWATMARPWIDYIARSSLLLQAGRYFADIAYFYGEEAPLTALFKQSVPSDLPVQHGYDFVNADVLHNRLSVDKGELVADSGARYKLLYLGGSSERMTLATLQRIAALVKQGATLVGQPPQMSPALQDDPSEFARLVRSLWRGDPVTRYGRGRVYRGNEPEAVLAKQGVAPDFKPLTAVDDAEVLFLHRRLDDGDAYFLSNRKNRPEQFEASFRVTGKEPRIWNAMDGSVRPVSYRMEGDTTVVSLEMLPEDAFFVVFRKHAQARSLTENAIGEKQLAEVAGPWKLRFQKGRGAPPSTVLQKLVSLDKHPQPGIRHFSGITSYSTTFTVPDEAHDAAPLWLDLGRVGDLAEVYVNGKRAGTLWFAPYRVDVRPWARSGVNDLEVRVANLWVNRLIGDQQPGAEKITFTAAPTYLPNAPLRTSGLLGPVRLIGAAP